jgi:DNA-binding LacI/PurR family transcriptional regulator
VSKVTLQTIADRVGVSRMTVSNAFSRPDQLSETLRERILAAARDLGYVGPDPAARALARGTTGAVGILLTDSLRYAFTDEVATGFLGAIAEELAPTGLAITLLTGSRGGDLVPARDVAMDGAVVYSCDPDSPDVAWLVRRRLPLVYVDRAPVPGAPSVNVDDRGGARAAAQHLVDLGHRRIGIVTAGLAGPYGLVEGRLDTVDGHPATQRMLGWLDALTPAGITPAVVRQPRSSIDQGYDGGAVLLNMPRPPTAVLAFSDTIAYGVVQVARDRGRTVPEELSVVGFDDNPLAARVQPALTTVRQDLTAKGRVAAAQLTIAIERARTDATGPAEHTMLPTELVVRHSTASPRPGDG